MKTISSILPKFSIYSLSGFLAVFMASCGSYQNTSYDNDGIYGASGKQQQTTASSGNGYKEYFGALQNDNQQPDQIFTDVESYNSNYVENNENNTDQNYSSGYSSWGSNPDNVTVNVYGNNWGYNNFWYSNYWGWNLGWGWNSWYTLPITDGDLTHGTVVTMADGDTTTTLTIGTILTITTTLTTAADATTITEINPTTTTTITVAGTRTTTMVVETPIPVVPIIRRETIA
jgi:hypothetical protein